VLVLRSFGPRRIRQLASLYAVSWAQRVWLAWHRRRSPGCRHICLEVWFRHCSHDRSSIHRETGSDRKKSSSHGKDLVEAVAAHVLVQRYGNYSASANFPTLLGQAFVAAGLCPMKKENLTAQEQMDVALYELACAVNRLRNREGTGHGRPFLVTVTQAQARAAVQSIGLVAARLLDALAP
jgi:hypothetical protein